MTIVLDTLSPRRTTVIPNTEQNWIHEILSEASESIVDDVADAIYDSSQYHVPVDEGNLKLSGYVMHSNAKVGKGSINPKFATKKHPAQHVQDLNMSSEESRMNAFDRAERTDTATAEVIYSAYYAKDVHEGVNRRAPAQFLTIAADNVRAAMPRIISTYIQRALRKIDQ